MTSKLSPAIAAMAALVAVQTGRSAEVLQVKAVRYWPLREATRVVVEVSGEFTYHAERLHNPERIFFDVFRSRPALDSREHLNRELEDKLLKKIRVAQTLPGVTRVVLDLQSNAETGVSQLANPNRLVIELRPKADRAIPAERTAPAPPQAVPPEGLPAGIAPKTGNSTTSAIKDATNKAVARTADAMTAQPSRAQERTAPRSRKAAGDAAGTAAEKTPVRARTEPATAAANQSPEGKLAARAAAPGSAGAASSKALESTADGRLELHRRTDGTGAAGARPAVRPEDVAGTSTSASRPGLHRPTEVVDAAGAKTPARMEDAAGAASSAPRPGLERRTEVLDAAGAKPPARTEDAAGTASSASKPGLHRRTDGTDAAGAKTPARTEDAAGAAPSAPRPGLHRRTAGTDAAGSKPPARTDDATGAASSASRPGLHRRTEVADAVGSKTLEAKSAEKAAAPARTDGAEAAPSQAAESTSTRRPGLQRRTGAADTDAAKAPTPREVAASESGQPRTEAADVAPATPAERKPVEMASVRNGRGAAAPLSPSIKAARPTADGQSSLTRALGLKVARVVLDPGHGGHDQGTVGPRGLLEKDLVLDVARRLGKLIEARMGAEVIFTRSDDTFVPLEGRTALANEKKADLFLSIHANSSPVPKTAGVETFYLNFTDSKDALDVASRENASSQKSVFELRDIIQKIAVHDKAEESKDFAGRVQASMYSFTSRTVPGAAKNRGVKKAPFVVLIGAHMPSVLAEIGFVSNAREEALLKRSDYRQKLADALCRGVQRYAGSLSHFQMASSGQE
jgi:N-acetylmuramoyl-L-alanine amidase